MNVRLMTGVPEQDVLGGVKHPVERERQLNDPEI
jgi:hypothetical protein